jgi:hypothetical protein
VPGSTDTIVRRLYEEPPEGFVATRAAAVEEARRGGDRETAKRLAALKKPTVAAWVVNLLALKRPDLIGELVDLATALRAAQRELKGEQLRELSTQRRQFVSALVTAARKLAVEAGSPAAKLPLAEVEATLTAALADPEIAEQVRTGRLIRAATYAGFGEVPRPRLRLVTSDDVDDDVDDSDEEPRLSAAAEQRRREFERKRRELDRELSAAMAAERRADKQLERAEAAERDAEHLVEDIEAELAELERKRTEAVADVARRKLARRTAERETAAARRQVGDVQAALDDLAADKGD